MIEKRRLSGLLTVILSLSLSNPAHAFIDSLWGYLSQYQLGLEYSVSRDVIDMSYKTAGDGSNEYCEADINESGQQICSHEIVGGQSSGIGIFIQQAFRRQGDIHFNLDLSLGVRYLSGEIPEEDATQISSSLPLSEASFSLLMFVAKPYLELGWTPLSRMPDLFLRFGPVLQIGGGEVSINEEKETVLLTQASGVGGYFEFEVVFLRFGDGALSAYYSGDSANRNGTSFYPNEINGMREFKAKLHRDVGGAFFGYGIKLLLNWP